MERIPFRKIRTGIPAVLFLVLLAGVIFGSEPVFAVGPLSSGHVVIFVLENKGFRDIIGNPDAPFINRLAESNVLLTDYHAMAHPSLPNYVAMLSGRTDGVHSDNPSLRFSDPTIAESLVRKGYSVKGYFQSLPEKGYQGNAFPPGKPLYVVRHNPFYLFGQIRSDPDWKRRIVPIEDLPDDLRRGRLPALSFVIGDLCHDMHGGGGCPPLGHADLVKAGDRFVAFWVRKIRRSSNWKKDRTIIVVTWDEGRYPVLQRIRDGLGRRPVRGGRRQGSVRRDLFQKRISAPLWGIFRPPEPGAVARPVFPGPLSGGIFRQAAPAGNLWQTSGGKTGSGAFVNL